MGAMSRRKGAAFERGVARMLSDAIGAPCMRNLEEVRSGNSGDILLPSHVPYSVQCKVGAAPPVWRAIVEARAAAKPGQVPLAIVRRNGAGSRPAEDLALLPVDAFVALLSSVYGAGGGS